PQVAIGPDGTATVIWRGSAGAEYIVQAATRPPGGSFGTPADLSAAGEDAEGQQIAIGPDGTATAVWYRSDGTNYIIQTATRPPGGSFGAPVDLSVPGGDALGPQIAIGPDGTATAVWYRFNGTFNIIQAVTRPPGGSFSGRINISASGQDAFDPQIAVGPDGTAIAVWTYNNGTFNIIEGTTRPPGGSFGTPSDLSESGQNAFVPQVAIGPDGTATAVWRRNDGIIQAATRSSGSSFGAPVDLSESGGFADYPQITIGPDGTATAIWHRSDGSSSIVQATTRPPVGSFGTPTDLSATGGETFDSRIAIGPDGTATAVWYRFNGTRNIVQTVSTGVPEMPLTVIKSGTGTGTVASSPAGIDCGTDCTEGYPFGTQVTLTAVPDGTSSFSGFSGAGCSGAGTCQVSMTEVRGVTATFTADPVPPVCPPNTLKKSGLKQNKKSGVAKLKVKAGGAGKIILKGSKNNRKSSTKVGSSGRGTLEIKAKGKAAKTLKKKGKVKIKVKYTYDPGSGCSGKTGKTTVKLVKKKRSKRR
ncbi:MAG: hypothetical protein WBW44_07540, partial [Solirubrobacterales bacterium]